MGFDGIWKWLCSLPSLHEWSISLFSTELCTSKDNTRKLLLLAEKILAENNSTWSVKFSLVLGGLWPPEYNRKTLWESRPCPLGTTEETSMEKKIVPLISQLVEELVHQAPNKAPNSIEFREFTDALSCKDLCNFLFLFRFFWVCACESPFEVGSLYFETLDNDITIFPPQKALNSLLLSLGLEHEVSLMRSLGYMYTKFMCLVPHISFNPATYSYSMEKYCCLRSYTPVISMKNSEIFKVSNTEGSLLRYILTHQQLEAVIQLKYETVLASDHIEVKVSIDNVRCSVCPLAFGKSSWVSEELYFPSKISLTVYPSESSQVLMMSLNKSSHNPSTKMVSQKILHGDCYSKFPIHIKSVSAIAACCTSEHVNTWRFEQRAEGHKGILEWVLYDNANGMEFASFKPGKNIVMNSKEGRKDRSRKAIRDKEGGVVFGRDEYGGSSLIWRLKRDCLQDIHSLKWNLRGCIWVTYCPHTDGTSYWETRFMEILEQVQLNLQ